MDISGHEHSAALVGLLYLPLAIFITIAAMEFAASRGWALGLRFRAGFGRLPEMAKLGLILVAASGAIHLAMVPAHLAEKPLTAALFGLDGLALLLTSAGAFVIPRWRWIAVPMLVANLAAYALYLAAGWETAEVIGVSTKAVEVAALLAIVIQIPRGLVPTISKPKFKEVF